MSGIDDTYVLRVRGLRKQYGREGGLVRAAAGSLAALLALSRIPVVARCDGSGHG